MHAQSGSTIRVLLVSENAALRDGLRRVLDSTWPVGAEADPHKALRVARRVRPGAVVAEAELARRHNWRFLSALRRGETAGVPLLLVAPAADAALRDACFGAGADDLVVDPVAPQELRYRVSRQMEIAELRAHAHRQRAFLDIVASAPIPICVLEGDELRFDFVNTAAMDALSKDVVVGRTLTDVVPEARSISLDNALREVLRRPEPARPQSMVLTLSCGPNEGQRRNWAVIPARLPGARGQPERLMVAFTDVTEQIRSREALRRLVAENDAANRAKDQFIAMLGHELRNPLSTIGSALELMHLMGEDNREQAVIKCQVGHMVRLVDGLLDLSRIAGGKLKLAKQRVDLKDVVESAAELVAPTLEQRAQVLDVRIEEGMTVDGDVVRLRQVFVNLLDNAGKYSSRGSRIVVEGRRDADGITVSVSDSGVGIDPAQLERIFELFAQENDATVAAGAGLGIGLAIVRSIVRMHGGEVTARSEGLGRGSEFVVTLPAPRENA